MLDDYKPDLKNGEFEFIANCPQCGVLIEGLANVVDKSPPDPGSVAVCIECRNWNILRADMKLHPVTELDIAAMSNEQLLFLGKVGKALILINKERKEKKAGK